MRDMKVCLSLHPSLSLPKLCDSACVCACAKQFGHVPDLPLPTSIFYSVSSATPAGFFVANGPGTPVSEMLRTIKPCQQHIGK